MGRVTQDAYVCLVSAVARGVQWNVQSGRLYELGRRPVQWNGAIPQFMPD